MNIEDAHSRYLHQAAWTAPARRHLLAAAGLANAHRVLEVGCGTGAVLAGLPQPVAGSLHGLDIDRAALALARQQAAQTQLSAGDAHQLPYPSNSFDIAFCHFVLLWLQDPAAGLAEMARVVRPGGAVLALAEPDYSQRRDAPPELVPLGRAQTAVLRARGADPAIGGQLPTLFAQAGLQLIDAGALQASPPDATAEAAILFADLRGQLPGDELEAWLAQDAAAWAAGTRQLHVPTYYALGRVP